MSPLRKGKVMTSSLPKFSTKGKEQDGGGEIVGKQGGRRSWNEHAEIKDMIQCLPSQQIDLTQEAIKNWELKCKK